MKTKLLLTAVLATVWVSPASAIILGVTFEGVGDHALVDEFYNGGIDSQGNSGTNLGLQFAGTARGAVDSDAGGGLQFQNNFDNAPSPDTVMNYASNNGRDPNDGVGVVNFAAGFDVGVSFLYSQAIQNSVVQIFSGLNGTGTELASFTLFENWQDGCGQNVLAVAALGGGGGDPGPGFCNWDVVSIAFDGIAQSIILSGAAGKVLFDNLTLGSLEPVPLPAAVWLLGSGLLGFAAVRSRRLAA